MEIMKNGKVYEVKETAKHWSVKTAASKLGVDYNVPKEICSTFEDLKKYIAENDLF